MNKDRYDRIFEKASVDERERITVLYDACRDLLEKYKSDRSVTNLKGWQAADEALDKIGAELEEKYFSTAPSFKNILEVSLWLEAEGYKVKKTKIYEDAKKGLIAIQPDKSVRKADVSEYILRAEIEKVTDGAGNFEIDAGEKARLEREWMQKRNDKLDFDLDREKGKYLLKSDVRLESALKISAFEAGVKHLLRTRITDWVSMTGGNLKKAGMVLELMYGELDGLLNEMGNMEEIGIVIRKRGEDTGQVSEAEQSLKGERYDQEM